MKIAIIGAAGVRMPLIVEALLRRQERLALDELALMDIDGERLELIAALIAPLESGGQVKFKLTRTTEARPALESADFVITTFRVGGIESRIADERIPLRYGLLGQETTGPGGFAMGLRSIPVLLDYVRLMQEVCPRAWLINFANPAGMLVEAVTGTAGWERAAGICDTPSGMLRVAAASIGAPPEEVHLDYFGLNHLGWVRSVFHRGVDYMPRLMEMMQAAGGLPGLPFDPELVAALRLIPNEYNYYYYYRDRAVENILKAGQSRGEEIAALNLQLFDDLSKLKERGDTQAMLTRYHAYLSRRGAAYMARETGRSRDLGGVDPKGSEAPAGEGYAGVALDVIEALSGGQSREMILNLPNRGAIPGMGAEDVVEVPALVSSGSILPLAVGDIPPHALGLMMQVKTYERLTIQAAVEGSYSKALLALTLHPLVADYGKAREILDEYALAHGEYMNIKTGISE